MSIDDWLETSHDLLIGYGVLCRWCKDIDWLTRWECMWSVHADYMHLRGELADKQFSVICAIWAWKCTFASPTPHSRKLSNFNLLQNKTFCVENWQTFQANFRVLISKLGTESDFELLYGDNMPLYPGETFPGKYLSTKPTGVKKLNI